MLGRRKERRKKEFEDMIYLIEIKEVCTALPLLISPGYHTLLGYTPSRTLERVLAVHQSSRSSLPLRGKKTSSKRLEVLRNVQMKRKNVRCILRYHTLLDHTTCFHYENDY